MLGFDPCAGSHELTACKDDKAKRSPKRQSSPHSATVTPTANGAAGARNDVGDLTRPWSAKWNRHILDDVRKDLASLIGHII